MTPEKNHKKTGSLVERFLKFIDQDTETKLISDAYAKVLANKELREKFAESFLMKKEDSRVVKVPLPNGKGYVYKLKP